jgi:hypothetical protein
VVLNSLRWARVHPAQKGPAVSLLPLERLLGLPENIPLAYQPIPAPFSAIRRSSFSAIWFQWYLQQVLQTPENGVGLAEITRVGWPFFSKVNYYHLEFPLYKLHSVFFIRIFRKNQRYWHSSLLFLILKEGNQCHTSNYPVLSMCIPLTVRVR